MDTDPKHTLEILEELQKEGFGDEAFRLLHHLAVEKKRNEKIAWFSNFCRDTGRFQDGGNNARVHQRLELVLKAYRGGGFKSRNPKVFRALAQAAAIEVAFPEKPETLPKSHF